MKEPFIIETFDSPSIRMIKAETLFGSIKVYGHTEENIRVEVYAKIYGWDFWASQEKIKEALDQYDLQIEQQGDTLILNSSARGEMISLFNTLSFSLQVLSISFKIYVPSHHFFESKLTTKGGAIVLKNIKGKHYINTKAGTIELIDVKGEIKGKTTLGTIDAQDCQARMDVSTSAGTIEVVNSTGDMIFATAAGTIELENLSGHISATTSAGTIDTNHITGTLHISTSAGTIDIKAMYGSINGQTGAGSVEAEILQLGDFVDLESNAGSISLRMPYTEGVNLDIKGDRIKGATFPNFEGEASRSRINGKANGGGKNIRLRSRNGSIKLNQPKGSFQKFSKTLKDPQFTLPSSFFGKNTEGVLLSLAICIILTYGFSSIIYFTTELTTQNDSLSAIYKGVFLNNVVNGLTVFFTTLLFILYISDKLERNFLKYTVLIVLTFFTTLCSGELLGIFYWRKLNPEVFLHEQSRSGQSLFYVLIPPLVSSIYFFFWQRSRQITRKISDQEFQLINLEKLKTKAELDALQARINPHFLYNSLNSIAGLVHHDPDKAEQMTLLLSKLFRYTTGTKDQHFNSIKDELEIVKTYLAIEQVRFEDRLTYTVSVEKDLENKEIPRFLLQPIVENAIKHGISKVSSQGEIHVKIAQEGDVLRLAVHDNGPAFSDNFFTGYGLQSIQDKLKLLYGSKAELNIQNSDYKQVIIKIPC